MSERSHPVLTIVLQLEPSPALLAVLTPVLTALVGVASRPEPALEAVPPLAQTQRSPNARTPRSPNARAPTAAALKPRKQSPPRWHSPERDAVLKRLWPTETPSKEIRRELAALDGPPLPKSDYVAQRAFVLGLKRPASMVPSQLHARVARPTEPMVAPVVSLVGTVPSVVSQPSLKAPSPAAFSQAAMPVRVLASEAGDRSMKRLSADRQQIIDFCKGRGWNTDKFDIAAINERLGALGHPGFTLIDNPPAGRRHA